MKFKSDQSKVDTCIIQFHTELFLQLNSITWKVPPRFELGLPDSESGVLTITPWDLLGKSLEAVYLFWSL